jgi:hypothetical protein
MACYLISYDLRQPERDYDDLIKAIKAYKTWAHITESLWAVVTTSSARNIRDNLFNHIDADDRLIVVRSGTEAAWRNPICRREWLKKHL